MASDTQALYESEFLGFFLREIESQKWYALHSDITVQQDLKVLKHVKMEHLIILRKIFRRMITLPQLHFSQSWI